MSPPPAEEAGTPGPDRRQKVVDALCEAFARDEIAVEEFERRVDRAHAAEDAEELRRLLTDLPSAGPPAPAESEPNPPARAAPPRAPARTVRDSSVVAGIFGGGTRRGSWTPARVNTAIGVLGGCELDFREARLSPGVTEVRVFALWGGVEVVVPPDVRVECSGIGIMGGFEHAESVPTSDDPDAPVIRVTGVAIMGGAEVNVRYPGESSRDAKRRLKREKKARKRLERGG